MAQLEKTMYTTESEPIVVNTNPSATWFAGILIALVVVAIGAVMLMVNNANNENALEMQKMQQDQASMQMKQSSLDAQQTAVQAQQAALEAQQNIARHDAASTTVTTTSTTPAMPTASAPPIPATPIAAPAPATPAQANTAPPSQETFPSTPNPTPAQ